MSRSGTDPGSRRPALRSPGFVAGVVAGALVTGAALWLSGQTLAGDGRLGPWAEWIALNLGHSAWVFALVLLLWFGNLERLARELGDASDSRTVAQLDQLSDVWIHLFVGIGVIWTAVGMRAALQVTLGDADAVLSGSAGSVLRGLVDGGILLALTTTIVGAVGGYLMRLGKTLWVGPALHAHYEADQVRDLRELIDATRRIEASVSGRGRQTDPADDAARPVSRGGESRAPAV